MLELNKIHLGDCLDLMEEIPDGSVDMILCDLPYGITACAWDSVIPLDKLWAHYKRVIKKRGVVVLTGTQPFAAKLIMSNFDWFKQELVWDKCQGGNFVHAKRRVLPSHENILIFYRQLPTYNPQKTRKNKSKVRAPAKPSPSSDVAITASGEWRVSKNYDKNISYPVSILRFSSTAKECNSAHRLHPTQKPVPLFSYLIRTYSNEGDVILDNCIGSGTTAISALETNRQFIGIEKDPEYHRIAVERVEKYKAEYKQGQLL